MTSPIVNSTPGPSPWYLRLSGAPSVEGFRWDDRYGTRKGKTLLVGPQGPVAALGFQNYVQLLDSQTLLIWFQRINEDAAPTCPVTLLAVRPREMAPLRGDIDSIEFRRGGDPIVFEEPPLFRTELDTTRVDVDLRADFPPELQNHAEMLILCHSSAIGKASEWTADLALLVSQPKASVYRLYPQDWFNNSNADFGYQWVTRVARDPNTGRIHGDGIRIGEFVLDESLRKVAAGFGPI